jgi:peptide/nickel transport system substrate-binding protein
MKYWALGTAIVAASVLVLAGCTSSKSTSESSPSSSGSGSSSSTAITPPTGSLTILVAADGGQNYDPQTNAAPSSTEFMMPVYDTLLTETPAGAFAPGLATAWNFSSDGLTLTLTLRSGVTFQDGSAFDSTAVKANIERGQTNPKSVIVSQLAPISSVDAPTPTSVVLHLKSAAGALLGYFAGPAGMMASPTSWANSNDATHPVGTGPWSVSSSSVPGSDMVYTAYAGYWNKAVQKVETVHIKVGAESTFVPGLTSNSAQAVMLTGAPTDGKTLSSDGLPVKDAGISYVHLLYLNKSGVLADPKVRQAISLAIDRSAICTSLLGGACKPSAQPVAPSSWAYDSSLSVPAQDIAQAKSLLSAAGHPNGISLKVVVSAAGTQLQTELTAIQQMEAKAGIAITIEPMPVANLLPALDTGAAQGYYSVNTGGADPAIPISTMQAPAYNPGNYVDSDFTSLMNAATAATTSDARKAAYQKVSAQYATDVFNVVILNQNLQYATVKNVAGITARDPLTLDTRGATVS